MMPPEFWKEAWSAALVNHLWQSTVAFLIAWLFALILRNNHARMRYWVWMIASVKFLVPFSLFIAAGEGLRRLFVAPIQRPALAAVMEQITQPYQQTFAQTAQTDLANVSTLTAATSHHGNLLPYILLSLWLCGFLAIVFSWFRGWRQIRASVRASSRMNLPAELPVLSSPRLLEPGVFGILHPVLLLPEGISDRLNPEQLRTILAHEICHLRRHDNLTAAIHMVVEALFWFHPAVWWIQARLLEERERACDEAVLQSGNESELYAESILNVCKFYVESPLACVSGVTGSDLKRRIVRIMEEQMGKKLDLGRKILLGLAATVVLAVPITFGLVHINPVSAQTNLTQDIAGDWQGTLHVGKDLRVVAKVTKADRRI
jgi:beta-lactamase regulating signal transducer with metallopeptidase domain